MSKLRLAGAAVLALGPIIAIATSNLNMLVKIFAIIAIIALGVMASFSDHMIDFINSMSANRHSRRNDDLYNNGYDDDSDGYGYNNDGYDDNDDGYDDEPDPRYQRQTRQPTRTQQYQPQPARQPARQQTVSARTQPAAPRTQSVSSRTANPQPAQSVYSRTANPVPQSQPRQTGYATRAQSATQSSQGYAPRPQYPPQSQTGYASRAAQPAQSRQPGYARAQSAPAQPAVPQRSRRTVDEEYDDYDN